MAQIAEQMAAMRRQPRPTPESLIRGIEVLINRLADPEVDIDLALLSRFERALWSGHHSNLLRLSVIEERLLRRAEPGSVREES